MCSNTALWRVLNQWALIELFIAGLKWLSYIY
uniref:Uncharacterized protein n=1 Tax=Arundo donax TaxID=35708 RepID=A0A0A9CAS3_ARUDO